MKNVAPGKTLPYSGVTVAMMTVLVPLQAWQSYIITGAAVAVLTSRGMPPMGSFRFVGEKLRLNFPQIGEEFVQLEPFSQDFFYCQRQ